MNLNWFENRILPSYRERFMGSERVFFTKSLSHRTSTTNFITQVILESGFMGMMMRMSGYAS